MARKKDPWGKLVFVEFDDGIAWVTLNRPDKRNAMSPRLNEEMRATVEALATDPRCGVFVLTGAGDSFAAGMDLKEYFRETDGKPDMILKVRRTAEEWQWRRMRDFPKPTIAMVNGWCFGGAYGPLFACDLAFCSDDAQFGLSEINWAILPGGGASKVAAELMGFRDAMYHAMMGENLTGKEAAAKGMVNESLPADKLKARVQEVADVLKKKDSHALRATKWAVRRVREMTYDNAEDYLIRAQEALNQFGGLEARKEATKQFLDDKSFKPGLGVFDKSKVKHD